MIKMVLAVALGASGGAILRWLISLGFNSAYQTVPLGTLIANLLGGYLMGLALAFFSHQAAVGAEWRLFVITGFLGSLTTFSAFSAEVTVLIQQSRMFWAAGAISAHVIGSLLMTMLGLATYAWIKG
ncbi:fluoride efflux transporter CrcB [Idiomarina tyrosinivorans]|uniref:Fluoride-specific ion channel FluC n=1 Tax=Idiomarina tyrosinivorans TaxID=1445662 RepID=A0A432ZT38_9GAMM|nr:fluoride efflux transporter CrcB [Idiomarina tyrosinivorans]RUO80988.1 fluoride efflux transporter CrcB [Idiomarina tyrosinivorans]